MKSSGKQVSALSWVSSLDTFCCDRQPRTHMHIAYNMMGCTIAVYIHFTIDFFIPHVLPTICLHYINAVVALRVIRAMCGFQVSSLSKVTLNSLASLERTSFEPFIDKEPKSGFRLWVNSTISVVLLLNCTSCSEAQFAVVFIGFCAIPLIQNMSAPVTNTARSSA